MRDETAASGTLITLEDDGNVEQALVSGIAFNRDEAQITVARRARPAPGIAAAHPRPGGATPTSKST